MKVRDLIAKLQEMDGDLPVTVADWAEDYMSPSEAHAERVKKSRGPYWVAEDGCLKRVVSGEHVVIGAAPDA